MTQVRGIHHVTAIAGDAQRNVDFYAGLLGLRLVKRTVNFDDPESYHLYYGDASGSPGSVLTFFAWPAAGRGRQGARSVGVTSFAVLPSALGFWVERLIRRGVPYEGPTRRVVDGVVERVVAFVDPDGLPLEIVGHPGAEARRGWDGAHDVAPEHALRGFHRVALWVERAEPTERVLVDTLGFRAVTEWEDGTRRFAAGDGGVGTLVDVRAVGGFVEGAEGLGTVHHVAWRVADDAAEVALRRRVVDAGLAPTGVIDRHYFRSVYFREPGGVVYELATETPGFAVDEPPERFGTRLALPPWLEPERARLEGALPPIHLPGPPSESSFLSADEAAGDGR